MKQSELDTFLRRKGYRYDNTDNTYKKRVRELDKRYMIKDNDVFVEKKFFSHKNYKLYAYSDIRELYINNNDKLSGLKQYIPN
jgi:hypothetical protein